MGVESITPPTGLLLRSGPRTPYSSRLAPGRQADDDHQHQPADAALPGGGEARLAADAAATTDEGDLVDHDGIFARVVVAGLGGVVIPAVVIARVVVAGVIIPGIVVSHGGVLAIAVLVDTVVGHVFGARVDDVGPIVAVRGRPVVEPAGGRSVTLGDARLGIGVPVGVLVVAPGGFTHRAGLVDAVITVVVVAVAGLGRAGVDGRIGVVALLAGRVAVGVRVGVAGRTVAVVVHVLGAAFAGTGVVGHVRVVTVTVVDGRVRPFGRTQADGRAAAVAVAIHVLVVGEAPGGVGFVDRFVAVVIVPVARFRAAGRDGRVAIVAVRGRVGGRPRAAGGVALRDAVTGRVAVEVGVLAPGLVEVHGRVVVVAVAAVVVAVPVEIVVGGGAVAVVVAAVVRDLRDSGVGQGIAVVAVLGRGGVAVPIVVGLGVHRADADGVDHRGVEHHGVHQADELETREGGIARDGDALHQAAAVVAADFVREVQALRHESEQGGRHVERELDLGRYTAISIAQGHVPGEVDVLEPGSRESRRRESGVASGRGVRDAVRLEVLGGDGRGQGRPRGDIAVGGAREGGGGGEDEGDEGEGDTHGKLQCQGVRGLVT